MSDNKSNCRTCAQVGPGGSCANTENCASDRSKLGSMNNIKKVVAVMSGKGGVGKSTVTSLLAVGLNQLGFKVGILDADITGPSIPKAFGVKSGGLQATQFGIIPPVTVKGSKIISVNLFLNSEDEPVIWRGPLLAGMIKQFWEETDWRDIDFLLVDLPPGTGDIPLTVMQTLPVDGIVVVTSPQELVLMVVKKTVKMAQKLKVPILGLVENMSYAVCPHCNDRFPLFGDSCADQVAEEMGMPLLGSLGWDPLLNRLMDQGLVEDYTNEELMIIVKKVAGLAAPDALS